MLEARESGQPQPQPNAGHAAIADLVASGKTNLLVTQNVDGLHQAAGAPAESVVEIHGCTTHTRCLECEERLPMDQTLDRVAAGEGDPHCNRCGRAPQPAPTRPKNTHTHRHHHHRTEYTQTHRYRTPTPTTTTAQSTLSTPKHTTTTRPIPHVRFTSPAAG